MDAVRALAGEDHRRAVVPVDVRLASPDGPRKLRLDSDGEGRWSRDGGHDSALRRCMDVDIELTPSTNTLPIRRLRPAVGETSPVTAAWVRFPALSVEPLPQRYTRLDEGRLLG